MRLRQKEEIRYLIKFSIALFIYFINPTSGIHSNVPIFPSRWVRFIKCSHCSPVVASYPIRNYQVAREKPGSAVELSHAFPRDFSSYVSNCNSQLSALNGIVPFVRAHARHRCKFEAWSPLHSTSPAINFLIRFEWFNIYNLIDLERLQKAI